MLAVLGSPWTRVLRHQVRRRTTRTHLHTAGTESLGARTTAARSSYEGRVRGHLGQLVALGTCEDWPWSRSSLVGSSCSSRRLPMRTCPSLAPTRLSPSGALILSSSSGGECSGRIPDLQVVAVAGPDTYLLKCKSAASDRGHIIEVLSAGAFILAGISFLRRRRPMEKVPVEVAPVLRRDGRGRVQGRGQRRAAAFSRSAAGTFGLAPGYWHQRHPKANSLVFVPCLSDTVQHGVSMNRGVK